MKNMAFTLRLKGETASLVNELMDKGYSESKTELFRTALIFYAVQLGIISPKMLHKKVLEEIKKTGKKYSDKEIEEQIKSIR